MVFAGGRGGVIIRSDGGSDCGGRTGKPDTIVVVNVWFVGVLLFLVRR